MVSTDTANNIDDKNNDDDDDNDNNDDVDDDEDGDVFLQAWHLLVFYVCHSSHSL